MTARIDRNKCCYCGGCSSICPAAALSLKETYVVCDEKKCVECGLCERICPVGAIKVERRH